MILRNCFSYLFLVCILTLVVGCQGGGDPVAPDVSGDRPVDPETMATPSVHGAGAWGNGHHLLALMECSIDVEERTITAVPLRTAFQHLDLIQIIPFYCHPLSACLEFLNLVIDEVNYICELDVVVHHPINDAYADVFDLRGIGIFGGTLDAGFDGGKVATQLLNADGYTTAYDVVDVYYDAFLNPYIAFNKDLDHRIFEHNTTTLEHFICQFPSLSPDDAKFLYALDANWSDPLYYDPEDPLTDPNVADPYRINILYVDPIPNQFLAEGTAVVEAYDWQGNASYAELECPALFGGPLDMTEAWSEDGRYLYYLNLHNDEAAEAGTYPLLVRVADEFESQPDLVDPTIIVELANYQLGEGTVYDAGLNTAPVASATADELFIEAGESVHFDASGSWDAEDVLVSVYSWDLEGDWAFDDGDTAEVDHQYADVGTYAANVMVTDTGGLTDILDLPIIINVGVSTNTPPVASAYASNTSPSIGQQISLNASNSYDNEDGIPQSWDWDLDNDGEYGDKSGEVIQHSWNDAGTYYVDVLVMDSGGLTDTLDTKLEIIVGDTENEPPVAIAEANKYEAEVGELVSFDGSESYDPDGYIVKYEWDLEGNKTYGDGFQEQVSRVYWEAGEYEIDLKVTDQGGLTDILDDPFTVTITGENNPPVAIAHADKLLVHEGEIIHFDATDSYDPEEGALSYYAWDLMGMETYMDAFEPEVDWGYLVAGLYYVDVMVCDSGGLCDTLDTKIEIQVYEAGNSPPVAVAEADRTFIYEGETVIFDGSGSFDPEDGAPTSWAWDLDGDSEYDDSPFIVTSKQYDLEGEYMVDLKVRDKEGVWDTLDELIKITVVPVGSNFPPEAIGSVNCVFPVEGQSVHFTNQSTDPDGEIVTWEWDFDEGEGWEDFTSTEGDVWHAFSQEGIYFVNHRVTDDQAAMDELDTEISVFVSMVGFEPPTDPPSCGSPSETHAYLGSRMMSVTNISTDSRDLAFLVNKSYLVVAADALYRGFPETGLQEPPLMYAAGWIQSIDADASGVVALSGLSDGDIRLYFTGEDGMQFVFLMELEIAQPIEAIAFDDMGVLWVYTLGELRQYLPPLYELDPCKVFYVLDVPSYGTVEDMEFSLWNRSIYLVVNDGAGGTVVEVDHVGNMGSVVTDVLLGPSNHMDIIIDKNAVSVEEIGCRIEVFGGIHQGYVTRLDADLNVLAQSAYGYWGIRAAALSPGETNQVIALEECCVSWLDNLFPPRGWEDMGGD